MKSPSFRIMAVALILVSFNLRPAINSVAPVLEVIRGGLGMSALAASLLTSIPVLCMGLIPPLAVKLGQRKGIERVIGWSLAVIAAGNALRLPAGSSAFLLATAAVAGIGIAAIGPLLSGFIKQHFADKMPAMISLYTVALAAGATAASALSVPLEARMHSWQSSLAIWAVPALIAWPVWRLNVLRRIPRTSGITAAARPAGLPWHSGQAWLLTLSFGLLGLLFYSITAWLPPVIEHSGYGRAYAGNMLMLFSLIQMPVGLAFPLLLRRMASRRFWLLLGSFSMLLGFAGIMLAMPPWLAVVLLGIGPGVLFPVNLLLPIESAADAREAVAWSAMTQSVGYVIGAAGPLLLGAIHDATGGYTSLIAVLMAAAVLMVFVQFRIAKAETARGVAAIEKQRGGAA
ncbi:putative transporter YycB [Paenibacillus solanacearum]|uniref:Transporter YycB n=1 Tax=Paenibacillus solanacearum TaxID=2048548 RepID=A0A916K1Z6_9BACL|nr:MFS transporter [Paenibacillus solanacearum]CAG7629724.1 putative transporter YycB [Paenibacillus solanacearum]